MTKRWLLLGLGLLMLSTPVWAMRMKKPPTLSDLKDTNQITALNQALEDVYNLTNGRYTLENIIVDPQGTRKGVKGDLVYATFGSNDHLCINTSFPAGFNWTCVNIGTLSTCPGGSDGQVQFNDNGNCGGDSDLTWEKNANVFVARGTAGFGGEITTPSASFEINPTNVTGLTVNYSELLSNNQVLDLNSGSTVVSQLQNQFLAPTLNGVAGGATETVTNAATVYVNSPPSGSNITFTNGPWDTWLDCTVDGDCLNLHISNSQANASGSTNETAAIDFGFGNIANAGQILIGKFDDFFTGANQKYSFFDIFTNAGGSLERQIRIGHDLSSNGHLYVGTTARSAQSALEVDGGATIGDPTLIANAIAGQLIIRSGLFVGGTQSTVWDNASRTFQVLDSSQARAYLTGAPNTGSNAILWFGDSSDNQRAHIQLSTSTGTQLANYCQIGYRDSGSSFQPGYVEVSASKTSPRAVETPIFVVGGKLSGLVDDILVSSGSTLASQRSYWFRAPLVTGVIGGSAETVTSGTTVYIEGAPSGSNITFTNGPYALWVGSGTSLFEGPVKTVLTGSRCVETDANGVLTASSAGCVGSSSFSGKITSYNGIATISNGVPSELAKIDSTGLVANIGTSTLYAVPSSGSGMYRVSAYVVETTAGSISSTLPNVQIVYNDVDTAGSITIDATPILGVAGIGQTGALTANTVGTASAGVIVINVTASTTIQYQTVNYASNLAGMTYALHIKLEAL